MRQSLTTLGRDHPVAASKCCTRPQPTFVPPSFADLGPEALLGYMGIRLGIAHTGLLIRAGLAGSIAARPDNLTRLRATINERSCLRQGDAQQAVA